MSTLATLQHRMQGAVLGSDPDIAAADLASARLPAATRIGIYIDAYRARLLEVLESDYPAVRHWLGPDEFRRHALDYIEHHRSDHYSVRWYGRHFPKHLRTLPATVDRPWLSELAAFEWAMGQAFDAADSTVVTETDMTRIAAAAWPGLRFRLHPSLQRLVLAWNVPALWQAAKHAGTEATTPTGCGRTTWILWRREFQIHYRSLAPEAAEAFDVVSASGTFADACARLAASVGEDVAPMQAASLLKGWLADGLIAGVDS